MAKDRSKHCVFPTTQWSLVGRADAEAAEARRQALNELLTRYWPALRAHLVVAKRIDPNEADDLLQGFVESKVLDKNLVARADSSRGRFRDLLVTSLDNYIKSWWRGRATRKRQVDRAVRLDGETHPVTGACEHDPRRAIDEAWAKQLLKETVVRLRAECVAAGREDQWQLFESRVLLPIRDSLPPAPYSELVERFGFESPTQAYNALVTAKRHFIRLLRDEVRRYALNEQEVDAEIRDLQRILTRR